MKLFDVQHEDAIGVPGTISAHQWEVRVLGRRVLTVHRFDVTPMKGDDYFRAWWMYAASGFGFGLHVPVKWSERCASERKEQA